MATTTTRNDAREPLTFANAPTFERQGVTFVDDDAVIALSATIAAEHSELLERLANE